MDLAFSTFFACVGGLVLMVAIYRLFASRTPFFMRRAFGRLQILSAAFMAFSHGSNDG